MTDQVYKELDQVKALLKELDAIIETSSDAMSIIDGNGVLLRVNRAYQDITGLRASEIVGKTMRQLIEDGVYDQSVSDLVRQGKSPATINQTIKGRNFLVSGAPVFDEQGEVARIVANLRDITELLKLQEQLEQSRAQAKAYKDRLNCLRSQFFDGADGIVFRSAAMEQVFLVASKVATVDATVLITGESGAGKEVVAKMIHMRGKAANAPFIKINCAALPEDLLESELFGYEEGSFSGARRGGKPGLFELAQNGSLFLDEIGDMSPALQVKLLRALQEKEIMRLGGAKPIRINARIIAATNRNLEEMLEKGLFREDLYYRLMVIPIALPPLRERKEDIPALISLFLKKYNEKMGARKIIGSAVMDAMLNYRWPGNIRELKNVIERMVVVSDGDVITPDHLPESMRARASREPRGGLQAAVENLEAVMLREAFQECGSWKAVAGRLGVNPATAYRKARRYGLLS